MPFIYTIKEEILLGHPCSKNHMVRPLIFTSAVFLSCLASFAFASRTSEASIFEVVSENSRKMLKASQSSETASYSTRLPQPAVPGLGENFSRNEAVGPRKAINPEKYYKPRVGRLSKAQPHIDNIPPIMKRNWDNIRFELDWFPDQNEHQTVKNLIEIILEDNYSKYVAFEPEFEAVFLSGYPQFYKNSRSVLGWLITFGSVNILSSLDNLKSYSINKDMLKISFKNLITHHPLHHLASMINLIPFMSMSTLTGEEEQNIFVLISQRIGFEPYEAISIILSKMKEIKLVHLALISNITSTKCDDDIQNMIKFCLNINLFILNSPRMKLTAERRAMESHKFKDAVQNFLSICVDDFVSLSDLPTIFSLARLFIEFNNCKGLLKLLTSHPEIASNIANYKSLLQTAIDFDSVECVIQIAGINPAFIFEIINGEQCPFVQALMSNDKRYFQAFLDLMEGNQAIQFHDGIGVKSLNAQTLAIILDRHDLLHEIVQRLVHIGVEPDLREALEAALNIKIEYFDKTNRKADRISNLISNSIWDYLLNDAPNFNLGIHNGNLLMDWVIIDRNLHAAEILVKRPDFDINEVVTGTKLNGNCARVIGDDPQMLKFLVDNGLNINGSISRGNGSGEMEHVPLLTHILFYTGITVLSQISGSITLDAAIEAKTYALQTKQNSLFSAFSKLVEDLSALNSN